MSLAGQIRFGLIIFVAHLMLATIWRAGETAILMLSSRPEQAAYFSIAIAAVTAATLLAIQATVMLTPSFTALRLSGHQDALDSSMGYGTCDLARVLQAGRLRRMTLTDRFRRRFLRHHRSVISVSRSFSCAGGRRRLLLQV